MAFEIFDTNAFVLFAFATLSMVVLPWSAMYVWQLLTKIRRRAVDQTATALSNGIDMEKRGAIIGEGFVRKNRKGFVVYVVLLALWFMLAFSLRAEQELQSFDPYAILEIPAGSSDAAVKKAYRAASLMYHPDKNPTAEGAEKFILVSKAYQTLTDPVSKENLDKYGNPDGYKGVTGYSIGLPKFLTSRTNESRVLLLYFLICIAVPTAVVIVWWRTAQSYTESGVLLRTLQAYRQLLNPSMQPKFLLPVLSFSAELEPLQTNGTPASDYKIVFNQVKDHMVKQKFFDPVATNINPRLAYVFRAAVLLHAYLLRIELPSSLRGDLDLVLLNSHKLLSAMLAVVLQLGHLSLIRPVIATMQLITQQCWQEYPPLMMLPHFDMKSAVHALKNKLGTVQQLRSTPKSKRDKLLKEFTAEQIKDIEFALMQIPIIDVDIETKVEGEKGIHEADVILFTATLSRRLVTSDDILGETSEVKDSTPATSSQEQLNNVKPGNTEKPESALGGHGANVDEEEELSDDALLDQVQPSTFAKKSVSEDISSAPLAYAPRFPFHKREKWIAFFYEKMQDGTQERLRLLDVKRIPALHTTQSIEFRAIAAAPDSNTSYTLVIYSDSYIACDLVKEINVATQPRRNVQVIHDELADHDTDVHKRSMFEDDEEYEGKWYLCGLSSIWELLLNVFVLSLLLIFIFNFMVAKGWWQHYVVPSVERVVSLTHPVWSVFTPFVEPVWNPLATSGAAFVVWISDKLHVEPPSADEEEPEIKITEQDLRGHEYPDVDHDEYNADNDRHEIA